MNTITKNIFDVSPFLLVEASADSEAVQDVVDDYDGEINESCSASSYESSCVTWTSQRASGSGYEEEEEKEEDDTVKEERDAGEEEEEEDVEGEVNSYRMCGRSQRENLAADEMSEMDKSRMFWEACLAS